MVKQIESTLESQSPQEEDEKSKASTRFRKLRMVAFSFPALAFVALLTIGLLRTTPNVKPGAEAPSFELDRLDGKGRISSERNLKGRPVVINFWASWCVPCRQEAPLLEEAWQRYGKDGVIFLGIDIQDAREDGLAFVREFGLTFPQARDPNGEAAGKFGVTGIPETFFIDHNWRFLAIAEGASTGEQRGNLVIRGAISSSELRSYVEQAIEKYRGRKE